jgi:DNA-binding transcriptional MerR regulator
MPTTKDLITTSEISRAIGVSPQRVNQLARARGIAPARTVGNAKLWRAADLRRFERRPPGRPAST